MFTKDDKKEIEEITADVITEVLIPALDRSFNIVNEKLDRVETRLDRLILKVDDVDRKLDTTTVKVASHNSELVDHGKRIKRLEKTAHLATT